MATPQQLREEVAVVTAMAADDLRAFIASLPTQAVREALFDLLPGLVLAFQETASTVASEWYDTHRLQVGAVGNFETVFPNLRDPGIDVMLRWAESEARSQLAELALIEGAIQRRIADAAREAIMQNVAADPDGIGYQRYSRISTTGCGFCQAIASRGAVYRTDESASFGAHDNCKCVAVPAFGGAPIPVRPYEPSTKRVTDADRARTREWLRKRNAEG